MMMIVMMTMLTALSIVTLTLTVTSAMMAHMRLLGSWLVLRHGVRVTRRRPQEQDAAQGGADQMCRGFQL
jgi:hypothetical protein